MPFLYHTVRDTVRGTKKDGEKLGFLPVPMLEPAVGLEPTTCCLQNPKWLVFMARTGVDSSCRLEPCGASQSQLLLHDNGRMWTSLEVQPVRDTVRSSFTVRDTVRTVRTIFGGSL